ncbi:DNA polymerase III subunit delta' [Cognatishimia maritima]|uniref:DNA polymerase III, delta prime subunit n=1 Tax=Cognatishimia maritima TaxID=870908 RepID=A0A1M5JZD2_9RHOB|nr:DNA polymerase III subunit delta' [Cognatishimia maritima]SHG45942.1 DNA polymerase III, delta prime subunit [Cognatishimia maritima]
MTDDALTESDRIEGAPHPKETQTLLGQDQAIAAFLEAFNSQRLHHGWLVTGPRGVGKATLAWQIARFLLATPKPSAGGLFDDAPQIAGNLQIDAEHPVARRIAAGAEPGLFAVRRPYDDKTKKLKSQITVDEIRKLKNFFALSSADGGRRVVIVDSADELNVSAANALLKVLEEPPADTTLLLISHQPSRLLPTIRSRCRELRLSTLNSADMAKALRNAEIDVSNPEAVAELSAGSVGDAIRLAQLGGADIYANLISLFADMPRLDRQRALTLAEAAVGRGAEERYDLLLTLIDLLLTRLARTGATGQPPMHEAAPGEAALLARLAPSPHHGRKWAETAALVTQRSRHGKAVNLDPAALVLDTVWKIQETAQT